MKTKTKVILAAALFMASAVIVVLPQTEMFSADSEFKVKDGKGTEFTYNAPSEKVISVGKGLSATIIEIGYLNKMVVCDSYSYSATEDVFKDLKTLVDSGDILADGNIYSSGRTNLINNIVYVTDNDNFNKEKDTMFITGGDSYVTSIVSDLRAEGFMKVLVWNDITTYEDLVDYVEVVSMVVSGSTTGKAEQMSYVEKYISDTLGSREKADAFYVTFGSGAFRVGNTGSLATSMILAAGGNAVTIKSDKPTPTYEENLTALIEQYGTDTCVFIDNTIASNPTYLENLRQMVPGVTLTPLESLWNNYDPDSMDGVWVMACAMYPDTFHGDVPTIPDDNNSDIWLYAGIAAVIIAIICVVGFIFIRRS